MAVTEYEHEPVRGLPGHLPPGETILWQGAPDWKQFALSAFFLPWIAGYFVVLAVPAAVQGNFSGAALTLLTGLCAIGLLSLLAICVSRTTVYTLTNRRVVLRIGMALPKCINIPLVQVASADLHPLAKGHGDIALSPSGAHRIGYALLWPHARPFRFRDPQPMLRSVAEATKVAEMLANACAALVPAERLAPGSAQVADGTPDLRGAMA